MASSTDAVVALALALGGCGNCGESEMYLPWTSKDYRGHETCGTWGSSAIGQDGGSATFVFAPHWGPALLRSGKTVDQTAVILFSVDLPADALAAPGTFDDAGATATVVAEREICATLGCGIDGGLIPLGAAIGEIENVEPASTVDGVAGITHQVWHLRWDLTFGDSADLNAFSAHLVGDDIFEY